MKVQQGALLSQQDNVAVLETVRSIRWTHYHGIFRFADGRFFVFQYGLRLQRGGLGWLEVGWAWLAGNRMSPVVELSVCCTPAETAWGITIVITGRSSERLRVAQYGAGSTQKHRRGLLLVGPRQGAHCCNWGANATWKDETNV